MLKLLVNPLAVMAAGLAFWFALSCSRADSVEDIRSMQATGDFESTVEPLRRMLSDAPDDPAINYYYGVALIRIGSPEQAIWSMKKAAADERWAHDAQLELGRAALAAREWENALQVANALLEADPDDIDARLFRANALIESRQRYEVALADIDAALARNPEHLEARVDRVAALIALGRVEEAAASLAELDSEEVLAGSGSALAAHICTVRATFTADRGLADEATRQFRDCRIRYPESRRLIEGFVAHLDSRGRIEVANEELLAQLESDPDDSTLRILLVRRLISMGRFDESMRIIQEGTDRPDPRVASDSWAALADLHSALGDFGSAAAAYERSLELVESATPFQLLALGDLLARAGSNERALEVAARIEEDVYRGLIEARVHLNRDDPATALARLDTVLPAWPNNPGARYWAARAAERLNRFDRAVEEYRQSIRSDPTFTDAALRLARLKAAEGEGEAAWSAVTRYASERPDDPDAAAIMMHIAVTFGPEGRLREVARALSARASWPVAVAERARLVARVDSRVAARTIRVGSGLDLTRPASAPALRALVEICDAAECESEALSLAEGVVGAYPDLAEPLDVAARAMLAAGRVGDARKLADRAVAADARNANARVARARCAVAEGRVEAALADYAEARRLRSGLVEAYVEAARALESSGSRREAEALWIELSRERPDHAVAAYEVARLMLVGAETKSRVQEVLRVALDWARRSERFGGGEPASDLRRAIVARLGERDAEEERDGARAGS